MGRWIRTRWSGLVIRMFPSLAAAWRMSGSDPLLESALLVALRLAFIGQ